MRALSVELQLLVIAHLSPVDIIRLQQTCKAFHALVEEFGDTVWRDCLHLQCFYNGVFWPTYKDLSNASELKKAATSPRRFVNAYEKWAPLEFLGMQATNTVEVKLPMDIDDIPHFYLVPGGRFLAIQEESRLTVWDLQLTHTGTSNSVLKPQMILEYNFESPFSKIYTSESVEDTTTLRFLLKTPRHGLLGHPLQSGAVSGETFSLDCVVLDLKFNELGILSILRESRLRIHFGWFLEAPADDNFAFHRNRLAMSYRWDGHITATVLWDFEHNEWALWWTGCDIYDICMKDNHLFYIHHYGLQAKEFSQLLPLNNDKAVYIPSHQDEDTDPSCAWPYKKSLNDGRLEGSRLVVCPDIFNPSSLDDMPMVYEVFEEHAGGMRTLRYRLSASPSLGLTDLREPRLKLFERCRLRNDDYRRTMVPEIRRICDGRVVTLWVDETAQPAEHSISISPPSEYGGTRSDSSFPALKSTMSIVRIVSEMPNSHADDEWQNMYQFCPVSGKVMAIRNNQQDEECYLRMYNFL